MNSGIGNIPLFRFLWLFNDYSWILKLFDQKKSSNNWHFIWWLLDWLFAADNPNNQKSENKMWIPRPFLTKILTHDISYYLMIIWWLFDDYLMIIWWLFALLWLFVAFKCERERLAHFRIRQAMLPQNTGGQGCTSGKGYLWFAWFLTARRSPCISM